MEWEIKDKIVVTKDYQTVPVPEDIDHTYINDEDQYTQEAEEVLQSSLLTSLQDKFLSLSVLVSLRYGFLQLSLLTSLQHGFLQSSLLIFLQSTHIHSCTTIHSWNLFLRYLYGNISTIVRI